MKKWKTEINLWSSMPEGTKVWRCGMLTGWVLQSEPLWEKEYIYVVDDDNAHIIKQWYDDASKLEHLESGSGIWHETTCATVGGIKKHILKGHKYRIKPDELIYYWQWEKLKTDGEITLSNHLSDKHAKSLGYESDGWRKIMSSKRVWNEY